MGRHAAPRGRSTAPPAKAAPVRATPADDGGRPPRDGIHPAAVQTLAFGGLAVVVVVVVLVVIGAGLRTALAVGLALLLLGVVAYLVLDRTGLLAGLGRSRPGPPDSAHPGP